MTPLAGLVLCGGRSRRMGLDKALLQFEGEPLVLRAARRLSRIADPVLLAPGVPGRLGPLGYPEVADHRPGSGPLGGVVAGLLAARHLPLAVVAVDMPHLSPEVLRLLAQWEGEEDAAVPVSAMGREPLHAVYSPSATAALSAALKQGRLSLLEALGALRVREVTEEQWRRVDPTGRFCVNLNRPNNVPPAPGRGAPGA